jgi:hypothetical protein
MTPLTALLNWRPCTKGWRSSKRRFGQQLIEAEEALIVHSLEEAEGLGAELKTDLVEKTRLEHAAGRSCVICTRVDGCASAVHHENFFLLADFSIGHSNFTAHVSHMFL